MQSYNLQQRGGNPSPSYVGEVMRICSKCGQEKDEKDFAKRKGEKYQTFCKECANAYHRGKYDSKKESARKKRQKEESPEKYKEIDRKAHQRYRNKHRERLRAKWREAAKKRPTQVYDKGKAIAAVTKWRKANKEKDSCACKARYAERTGKLIAPKRCQICGTDQMKLEKHHADYSKPLEVIWCCRSCHAKLDRIRRDQE